jgi:predicted DNA-binding helix-hairpin-helix protein
MIVGATAASDRVILATSASLYARERLRRVYYSAFSPIPDSSSALPNERPPLVREHRLYQADWLMRFYGFEPAELTSPGVPNLDLHVDPKLAWALRNRDWFPVDVNRASKAELLRVPGIGARNVERILQVRRWHQLRLDDLVRLRIAMQRAVPFVVTADHRPRLLDLDATRLEQRVAPKRFQLDLFGTAQSALTGQL